MSDGPPLQPDNAHNNPMYADTMYADTEDGGRTAVLLPAAKFSAISCTCPLLRECNRCLLTRVNLPTNVMI